MTPRQLSGYMRLAGQRRARELAELLTVAALGAQGDPKAVQEQIERWSDQS